MNDFSDRVVLCAGMVAVACAYVFPLLSPGVIHASSQPPPAGYGGCAAPSDPGFTLCNPVGASGTVDRMELWVEGTKIANFPGNEIATNLIEVIGEVGIVEVDSKGNSLSSSFFYNGPC